MSEQISIQSLPNMPTIVKGDDIGELIVARAQDTGFILQEKDVLCVASKAVSSAEDNVVALSSFNPGDVAHEVHKSVPRKDVRAIQAIIDSTGDPTGSRLEVRNNYVGGWLPNGLFLTSAGVDKLNSDEIILLPRDADASARAIGQKILELTGLNISVIITDSEGRPDKKGSAQIAIGVYGIPPLRVSEAELENGQIKQSEETVCDMLAASAALLMGQRGFNRPVVRIQGFDYDFDENATISDALNGK